MCAVISTWLGSGSREANVQSRVEPVRVILEYAEVQGMQVAVPSIGARLLQFAMAPLSRIAEV